MEPISEIIGIVGILISIVIFGFIIFLIIIFIVLCSNVGQIRRLLLEILNKWASQNTEKSSGSIFA